MKYIKNILLSIRDEESKVDLSPQHVIEYSRYLACYLLKKHQVLKEYVLENGFSDINQEIEFFKKIKPEIQGKLIFYNKVFRIETACPIGMWQVHKEYFSKELQKIEQLYQYYKINCLFCQYYHLVVQIRTRNFLQEGRLILKMVYIVTSLILITDFQHIMIIKFRELLLMNFSMNIYGVVLIMKAINLKI